MMSTIPVQRMHPAHNKFSESLPTGVLLRLQAGALPGLAVLRSGSGKAARGGRLQPGVSPCPSSLGSW